MIDIAVEQQSLDLLPDTTIRWKEVNPVFSPSQINTPVSFGFDLPVTKNNRSILDHADVVEMVRGCANYSATIKVQGYLLFEGLLFVERSLHKTTLTVRFRTNPTKFAHELDFGGVLNYTAGDDYLWPHTVDWYNEMQYPDAPIYFPRLWSVPSAGFVNLSPQGTSQDTGEFCPFLYVKYLLDVFASEIDRKVAGTFFEDTEINDLLIYNNRYLSAALVGGVAQIYDDLDYANHVPRVKVARILEALASMFCLGVYIEPNKVTISDFKSMIVSAVTSDWTDIADPIYETENTVRDGYKLSHTFDSTDAETSRAKTLEQGTDLGEVTVLPGSASAYDYVRKLPENEIFWWNGGAWEMRSYDYSPIESDPNEQILTAPCDTPFMFELDYIKVDQAPNYSPQWGAPYNDFGIRFLFRRGWHQESGGGSNYALGSGEDLNTALDVIGNYVLRPNHATKGTYQIWWKDYIEIMSCQKLVSFNVNLTIADLASFKRDKPITIDKTRYLWKEIDIVFSLKGIDQCQAQLIKL